MSWSDTQIVASTPAGVTSTTTAVVKKGDDSNAVTFNIVGPSITQSPSPSSAPGSGAPVIYGARFGTTKGSSTVTYNGVTATQCDYWNDTWVSCLVPMGATSGPVIVTVNGVASNAVDYVVAPQAHINSISPAAAAIGNSIIISGYSFYDAPRSVYFPGAGWVTNTATNWTDTSITLPVPAGATSGGVIVRSYWRGDSQAYSFTVAPGITGLSASSALVGSSITITGTTFGATQGSGSVTIGGQAAAITSWSNTSIVATVPVGANSSGVQVTQGVASNTAAFTPLLPHVDQLNPTTAIIGAPVTILGSNFGSSPTGASVTVNGTSMSSLAWSDTEILVQVPTSATTGNIVVSRGVAISNGVSFTVDSNPLPPPTDGAVNYTYNDAGQVLTVTDSLGNRTYNTYDTNGNLLSTTVVPGDGKPAVSTSFDYDVKGQLIRVTDQRGYQTNLSYNSVGLAQAVTDAQGNVTSYTYDARGNRKTVTDAAQNITSMDYDLMNSLIKVTNPDNSYTSFAYDTRGRRTSVTDANSKTTTYAFDDADRMTSVTDAASNVTAYAYDSENNLTGITDAKNHTTSFEYDDQGRVKKTIFPSALAESYNYDAVGRLGSKIDRKGDTTTYTYDVKDRLTRKNYQDNSGVDYTYDVGNRMTQASDATGTYQFSYDSLGKLSGTTTNYSFVSGTYSLGYTYDIAGNRLSMTAPQNAATNYVYDSLSRLTSLTGQGQQFIFAYDVLGRRTSLTRPNGVLTTYAYNNLSNLTSVVHKLGSTVLDGFGYTPDSAGNHTAKVAFATGTTEAYSYDPSYQLTQVVKTVSGTPSTTESFSYDPVGNRTASLGVASYTVNPSNQLTSSSDGAAYTYDSNGNTLTKTVGSSVTQYQWDYENRLKQVTLPDNSVVTFKYDPFGRRIQKTSPVGTTNYVYDGSSIIQEFNASATVTAQYVQGPESDEPLAYYDGSAWSYYEQDGLGSVTSLTDASGAVSSTYSSDSFGNPVSTVTGQRLRYTGREWDDETGLYYYRARYYDSSNGRFLSEDPIGFAGGINMYAYVSNGPVNRIDPSGLADKNPISASWGGIKRNANFAWNWFWETNDFGSAKKIEFKGKPYLFYGPDTPETRGIMRSAGGLYMQLLYRFKYKCVGSSQNHNFRTLAGYLLTTGDPSNTAFQVGAFSFDIKELDGGMVEYTMYNKAGWHSLLGGLNFGLGDHERQPDFPMHEVTKFGGDVRQMFQWRGKKPCGCK